MMIKQPESKSTDFSFVVQERAVLYARVSGNDNKYSTSGIESQLADCRKYSQEKNYRIVGEFNEEPNKYTSGFDWLPELEKILELAEQGSFDVLVVREVDRLARNRFKQMSIENRLQELGIRVEYVIGQYENTSEGRLLKGIMSEFAEFERDKINERMTRGRIKAIKKGAIFAGGTTPYGYDLIDKILIPNDYEASVVKLIFDLYTREDYSILGIASYLNEHSIPPPAKLNIHKARAKRKQWSNSTVSDILSNETYVGRWYYGKNKVVKNPKTGGKKYVPRPREEWLLVKVPPIVDESTFQVAQERKKENKQMLGRRRKYNYLIGGMIKCGHCGNGASGVTQIGRNGMEYSFYVCNAHRNPSRYGFKCEDGVPFKAQLVEFVVWNWIKSILMNEDNLNTAIEKYQKEQLESKSLTSKLIEANQGKLAELEARKAKLIDGYTKGVFTLDDIAPKKVQLDDQIADLVKAVKTLQSELIPTTLTQEQIDSIREFAAKIRKGLTKADDNFEARRKIVELLRLKVVLLMIGGKKYADVECVLGNQRLEAENGTVGQYCG